MNCESCDKVLEIVKNIRRVLNDVSDWLESEQTENASAFREVVEDRIVDLSILQEDITYEAIKAHMNRYLFIYGQLEKHPCMSEDDLIDGYATLGSEQATIERLFKDE